MIDGEYKLVGLICSHFRMISSRAMSAEEEQMLQGACACINRIVGFGAMSVQEVCLTIGTSFVSALHSVILALGLGIKTVRPD